MRRDSKELKSNKLPAPSQLEALKLVLQQALPNFGDRLSEIASGFTNNIFLARAADPAILPASNYMGTIQMCFMTVNNVALTGVGEAVASANNNEDQTKVGQVFRQGILLATIMGIPTIVIVSFSKPILIGLGQEEHLANIVQDYFRAYAIAVLPTLWLSVEKQLVMGLSKRPWPVFVIQLVNSALTTGAAYILINGVSGINALGSAGLGYAEALSAGISLIGFTSYLAFNKNFAHKKLFQCELVDKSIFTNLLKNGLPIAFQFGTELMTLIVSSMMVGRFGNDSLSAQQVSIQYVSLILAPLISLSQANLLCNSQALAEGRVSLLAKLNLAANGLGLSIVTLAALLVVLFKSSLVEVFLDQSVNQAVNQLAEQLLWISVIGLFPDAIRYISGFALIPLNEPLSSMLASIVGLTFVGLPLGYLLGFTADLGATGITIARNIGVAGAASAITWRTIKKIKQLSSQDERSLNTPTTDDPTTPFWRNNQSPKQLEESAALINGVQEKKSRCTIL